MSELPKDADEQLRQQVPPTHDTPQDTSALYISIAAADPIIDFLEHLRPGYIKRRRRGNQKKRFAQVCHHMNAVCAIRESQAGAHIGITAAVETYAKESGTSVRRIWAAIAEYRAFEDEANREIEQRRARNLGYYDDDWKDDEDE